MSLVGWTGSTNVDVNYNPAWKNKKYTIGYDLTATGWVGYVTVPVYYDTSKIYNTDSNKKAMGGVFQGGRWRSVTAYAGGTMGAPTGQLFLAREAGPELVGTLGGHTAVMNNDQIVASVAAGVAEANEIVVNAVLAAANQIVSAVAAGGGDGVDIELIARGVTSWQKRQARAMGI